MKKSEFAEKIEKIRTENPPFTDQMKDYNFKDVDEVINFLKDKSIIILSNTNSHNYGDVGEEVKLDNITRDTVRFSTKTLTNVALTKNGDRGNNIKFSDFSVKIIATVSSLKDAIDRLEERRKIFNQEIDNSIEKHKEMLEFMEELDLVEFDKDKFKTHLIKKIINKKASSDERANAIINILQG